MSEVKKFRKKPVEIEAIKWDGFIEPTLAEIALWCDESWADESMLGDDCSLIIPTLEGAMKCDKGDWIIKGINGEFYPCKDDIFKKTYYEVN
jgi:hypothetical protein